MLPAPVVGKGLRILFRLTEDGVHHRLHGRLEETVDLAPRVGMRAAHETLTDESDIQFRHRAFPRRASNAMTGYIPILNFLQGAGKDFWESPAILSAKRQ